MKKTTQAVAQSRPHRGMMYFREKILARCVKRCGEKIMAALGGALLLLFLLEFPHHPFDATHDLSSHATFEYYAAHDFQFGTEVYQNVGPYGYVHYAYSYIGYLPEQKVVLKTFCRLLLGLLIFALGRTVKSPWGRFLGWASLFVFYPLGDATSGDYLDLDENYAYLTVYLSGLWLLQDRTDRAFLMVSGALWFFLGFLSLTKHTCFVLGLAVAGAVVLQNAWRRHLAISLLGAVTFPLALVVHWVMARQAIGNLPAFVQGIFSFSHGYNEAMSLEAPAGALGWGMAVLVLLCLRMIGHLRQDGRGWGRAVLEGLLWFVLWKHAFVRADVIHVLIFFYAALLGALPMFFCQIERADAPASPTGTWINAGGCAAVILLAVLAFYAVFPEGQYRPVRLVNHLRHNWSWLVAPRTRTQEMAAQLRAVQNTQTLPQTKAAAGQATIDFFGDNPGYLLLNEMNYHPRPMPMAFAAVNPPLQAANERFYRDPATAPRFVLYGPNGIDGRFYQQDDAQAFRALLDNYRPVLLEADLLLLQHREKNETTATRSETLLTERVVQFGETVSCEPWNGQPLWLEAHIMPTVAGKLRSFFYQPRPCFIGWKTVGAEEMVFSRFVTAMGECGVMLNPVLGDRTAVLHFYDPHNSLTHFARVREIVFTCAEEDRKFFQKEIRLRFYTFARPSP